MSGLLPLDLAAPTNLLELPKRQLGLAHCGRHGRGTQLGDNAQRVRPAFAALVPYTTVLVRLDEQDDILIPGRFLSDVEPHQGMRVRAVAEKLTEELGELNWIAEDSPT